MILEAEKMKDKDKDKTKEQLINELAAIRKRLAKLERSGINTRRLRVALKEKEEFLKETLDSIQDGISLLDKDLNIIFTNSTMKKWYAHQLPLMGKKCYEAYHNHREHCEICPSMRTLSSGNAFLTAVFRNKDSSRSSLFGFLFFFFLLFPIIHAERKYVLKTKVI